MNATQRRELQDAIDTTKRAEILLKRLQYNVAKLAEGQRLIVSRLSARFQATPHGKREMDEADALDAARDWLDNAVDGLERAIPFLHEANA